MQSTDCVLKRHFCCERKAYFMRLSTNAKGTTPCNTAGGRVPQERDQHGPRTGSPRAGRSSQGQNSETQAWLDSSAPRSLSLNTLRRLWFVSSGCSPRAGSSPSVSVTWLLLRALKAELARKVGRWMFEAGPRAPLPNVADTFFVP